MKIRNGKYLLNTDTAVKFDCGSTGRLGHYSTQGDRQGYVCKHRDGAFSVATVGSGYYPCPTGGMDWERRGVSIETYADSDDLSPAVVEALCEAGLLESIE